MAILLKNPLSIWLLWFLRSIIILIKNRSKNLKIGYLAKFHNVTFGDYNTFYDGVEISNSIIGNFVYIARGTRITNTQIGNFCSIGPDVRIGLGKHPTTFISTFPAFFSLKMQCQISFIKKPLFDENGSIVIGNDVWIGANSIILDDIKIGDGAIIAAGSVVTKDVKPYSIVGGIPAKEIKKRFSGNEIDKLLTFKWWDKGVPWIKENCHNFNEPDRFFKDKFE